MAPKVNSLYTGKEIRVKVKVSQSCPTLCDPMDYNSPWNSLGQNTGVGSLSLLQGFFPSQGSNPGLPHCRLMKPILPEIRVGTLIFPQMFGCSSAFRALPQTLGGVTP